MAVEIAKKINGEIISADSRQVYKYMDLGTGKVPGDWNTKDQQKIFVYKDIPHYLIDFKNPREEYNVSHFKKDAEDKIIQISKKGKIPIMCGGTGFWISALVHNKSLPEIKPDPALRKKLEEKDNRELLQILYKIDPKRASSIDQNNRLRLIRSTEIAKKLGKVPKLKTLSKINGNIATRKIKDIEVDFYQFAIATSIENLEKKIKTRLNDRYRRGMVKEVKKLNTGCGLAFEKIQSFGLAYYWIPLFLKGELTEEEVLEKIYLAERRYAKKQLTWLKKEKGIKWIKDAREILRGVKS
jgi:tRNA dimethylallyltransferase